MARNGFSDKLQKRCLKVGVVTRSMDNTTNIHWHTGLLIRQRLKVLVPLCLLWLPAPTVQAQQPAVEVPSVSAGAQVDSILGARWQPAPRRQTLRGARIGAIVGAIGGFGAGGFLALICRAENDRCDGAIPLLTVLGSASGAIGGAILGAAVPADPPPRRAPAPTAARRTGSATLSAGAAHGRVDDFGNVDGYAGSGLALRANLFAELRPWLAIGPDAGIAWAGDDSRIRHVALGVRSTWQRGTISPYVAANVGAYQATRPSLEFLGGALGVGARWQPTGGRMFLDVEGRLSRNVQNIEPMRMRSVYAGAGMYW